MWRLLCAQGARALARVEQRYPHAKCIDKDTFYFAVPLDETDTAMTAAREDGARRVELCNIPIHDRSPSNTPPTRLNARLCRRAKHWSFEVV